MRIRFREWLHKKFNIHYWCRYNVRNVSFRTCYICGLWQKWDDYTSEWINWNTDKLKGEKDENK